MQCHWCGKKLREGLPPCCEKGVVYVVPDCPVPGLLKIGSTTARAKFLHGARLLNVLRVGKVGSPRPRPFWLAEVKNQYADEAAVHRAMEPYRAFWERPPNVSALVGWKEIYTCTPAEAVEAIQKALRRPCRAYQLYLGRGIRELPDA